MTQVAFDESPDLVRSEDLSGTVLGVPVIDIVRGIAWLKGNAAGALLGSGAGEQRNPYDREDVRYEAWLTGWTDGFLNTH